MSEQTSEIEALRSECERLRRERDALRREIADIESDSANLAEVRLRLVANALSKEIKEDFYGSVQRGLWIVGVLGIIATAGGWITLSDLLRSRIDAAVEGKHKEIQTLRDGIVDSLADVKVQAKDANREVEILKADVETTKQQFSQLKQQVEKEGAEALAAIRGVTVSITSTVDRAGNTSTKTFVKQVTDPLIKAVEATKANPVNWFGPLPSDTVGIAGSSIDEFATESSSQGVTRGDFSVAFQSMLRNPSADTDRSQTISLREAVTAAISAMDKRRMQHPFIAGESQNFALFSTVKLSLDKLPKRKVWAILVGIGKYPNNELVLNGPVNDVNLFARMLRDRNHLLATDVSIELISNELATFSTIQSAFEKLEKVSSNQDIVVFYFSGHATGLPAAQGPATKGLLPYDWQKGAQMLLPTELVKWLSRIPAKQKVMIVDA